MVQENFGEKLLEIGNLLKIWSRRKLTLIGKITVLKTLIMPKIVHLLTVLPSPSFDKLKKLDTLFFRFLWDNKPDKIKRDVLCKSIEEGGLNMIDVFSFNKSLKLSWIKRLVSTESPWVKLFEIITGANVNVINFGDVSLERNRNKINPFWIEVANYWSIFYTKWFKRNVCDIDILSTSLWSNSLITIGHKPVYYHKFVEKKILFIHDLLNERNVFYTHEEIESTFKLGSNFMQYLSLISAVKTFLRKHSDYPQFRKTFGPVLPLSMTILEKCSSCRGIYKVLSYTHVIPTAQKTYSNEGLSFQKDVWKQYYIMPFQCTRDTSPLYFQYKILHRVLATNSVLFKIGIADSDACTFCQQFSETIQHIFFDCEKTSSFLSDVHRGLLAKTNINVKFDRKCIIFGNNYEYAPISKESLNMFLLLLENLFTYRKLENAHQN